MAEKNTRDIILEASIILFSSKGYAAVSMRDIAKAVGIQPSSIYHHFSGKQELFDALIQKAKNIKDYLCEFFIKTLENVEVVDKDDFIQAGVFFLTDYLENAEIGPLLKVLESERLHNKEADTAWMELLILAPLKHEIEVFRIMKERGELLDDKINELAAEYQSAILLAYFTGDIEQLKKQLERFYIRTIKTRNI